MRRVKEKSRYTVERVDEIEEFLSYTEERFEREREDLVRALDRLPGQGRVVFSLVVLEDMKYKEVAERLGISVNTVKTHLSRTLKQLRESLGVITLIILRATNPASASARTTISSKNS